jgi:DNA-binding NarL/FixJ family response regulator
VRVLIADDEPLIRDGVARLLQDEGFEIAGTAVDAEQLLRRAGALRPDVALIDIRMPPNRTDDGLLAAQQIRSRLPGTAVLVLSQYLDSSYAHRLLEHHPAGVGYLLKERVSNISLLSDAIRRVADGECVIDPTIVSRLLHRPRRASPLDELSPRELEVLALMAEGRSNQAISDRLVVSPKTVEAHVRHVFTKLMLPDSGDDHRRVLAVITYLREQ